MHRFVTTALATSASVALLALPPGCGPKPEVAARLAAPNTTTARAPALGAPAVPEEAIVEVFDYQPPASGNARSLTARFAIGDDPQAPATRPAVSPYYVGVKNAFYRMPTAPIPLPAGRYTFQLIGPDGKRLSGILDLQNVDTPITDFATVPVLSSLTEDLFLAIKERRDDPVMLKVRTKPHQGEAPITIAEAILGSRQSLLGAGPSTDTVRVDRTRNLEFYLDSLSAADVHYWDAVQRKWLPCPRRFHVPVDHPTDLSISPVADSQRKLVRIYVRLIPNPDLAGYPSAGILSVRLGLTDHEWEIISADAVRRHTGSYTPPETGPNPVPVRIYEAILGNRPPLEEMRMAETREP